MDMTSPYCHLVVRINANGIKVCRLQAKQVKPEVFLTF